MPQFGSERILPSVEITEPGGLLDDFVDDHDGADGLAIEGLAPGTVLEVQTRNSRYRLTLLDGDGHALVTGGALFREPTEVRIEGSTAGGSSLKLGWIGVGLRLELSMGKRLITTSDVRSVEPVAA
jgi:hypothetical protein